MVEHHIIFQSDEAHGRLGGYEAENLSAEPAPE